MNSKIKIGDFIAREPWIDAYPDHKGYQVSGITGSCVYILYQNNPVSYLLSYNDWVVIRPAAPEAKENKIEVDKVYTDGKETFRVVYANKTMVCAYRSSNNQLEIFPKVVWSLWKDYVKPPKIKAKDYEIIWRKAGINNISEYGVVAVLTLAGTTPPDVNEKDILKRETISYKK